MTMIPALTLSLASALGIGLLVGLERERKNLREKDQAPAGLRTFAITSLLGWAGLSLGGPILLAVLVLGLSGLLAVAYYRSIREDPGLTTEVALLLVLLLGAQAVSNPGVAVALSVILALLLAYRENLHYFVRSQLSETEIRDGLILASAALVILPLVPDAFIGPFGAINLRTVWMLCVLIMSISAVGHLAIRIAGPRFGLPLAGFIAGFASSTATVGSMGGRARQDPERTASYVSAAVMSTVATMVLMAIVLAAIDTNILSLMLLPLALAGVSAFAYAATGFFTVQAAAEQIGNGRVFDLRLTLGVTAVIALVQVMAAMSFHFLGNNGVLFSTGISGFADAQAAAASAAVLVPSGKMSAEASQLPILVALSTNTVSKLVMAFSGGRVYCLRVMPGLLLPMAVLWLYWWLA
ncbi:MAG: DUF4010 domain-containing protein [bacterium]|nr:DUF4010 domain-containing protein [bacterium]